MTKGTVRLSLAMAALLGWLAASTPATAIAGDFSVAPIRMFLGANRKADVVTIKNNGTNPLRFEIQPKEWTQDADGKDVYAETGDLLVFPRLMTLRGGEDRDIRVGMKIPRGNIERTYRVFINELPPPVQPGASNGAANVGFLINFGLPVFFAPIKPVSQLKVEDVSLAGDQVNVRLANTGNIFQFVEEMTIVGLDASGAELFREPIVDRYLLAGSVKSYTASVPAEKCKTLAVVSFSVRTDKASTNAKKDVNKNFCGSANPEHSSDDAPR